MTKKASSGQRWFLEVLSEPCAGQELRLKPGQQAHVGRDASTSLACTNDFHMSGVHFAVRADGESCRIQDLKSRNGTFLNGSRIQDAALAANDVVTAGETAFILRSESGLSAPATRDEHLSTLFHQNFQPLFAILDSARDPYVLALLLQSQVQYQSLYEGPKGESLSNVAPYLVRLPANEKLLNMLIQKSWGHSWGIYLKCSCEFQELRRHLRHFLEVRRADGEQVYFRFYDPRVLRLYLPALNPAEAGTFWGPISCYLVEDENSCRLLQFVNTGQGLSRSVIPLVSASPLPPPWNPE